MTPKIRKTLTNGLAGVSPIGFVGFEFTGYTERKIEEKNGMAQWHSCIRNLTSV